MLFSKIRHIINQWKPLTLSEGKFWVINKSLIPIIGAKLIIEGPFDAQLYRNVLKHFIENHSVFWQKISRWVPMKKPTPITSDFQIEIISENTTEAYRQNSYDREIRSSPFNYEAPLIKIFIYKIHEEKHEVHFFCPHILCDFYSFLYLHSNLDKNYQRFMQENKFTKYKSQSHEPPPSDPLYYKKIAEIQKNSYALRDYQQNKLIFLKNPDKTYPVFYINQTQLIHQLAKKFNVNDSTILLSACLLSIEKTFKINKIRMLIFNSGRNKKNYHDFRSIETLLPFYIEITKQHKNIFINETQHKIKNTESDLVNAFLSAFFISGSKNSLIFKITNILFKFFRGLYFLKNYQESLHVFIFFYLGFNLRRAKEKLAVLLSKLGFKIKTDVLVSFNYIPASLDSFNPVTHIQYHLADEGKIYQTFNMGCMINLLFWKKSENNIIFSLIGRNITFEQRRIFFDHLMNTLAYFEKDTDEKN